MNTKRKRFGGISSPTLLMGAAIALVLGAAMLAPAGALAVKTYNQKGYAMASFNVKKYKVLKNKNFGTLSYAFKGCALESTPHYLHTTKGDLSATMTTWAYLPKSYDGSGDMGNPQAVAITPNGKYAYISYAATSELQKKFHLSSGKGRIVRFDLEKLESYGVNTGDMTELVEAARDRRSGRSITEHGKQLLSCLKFGPWIDLGHGATLCYDYKRACLWYSVKGSGAKASLVKVSASSMKPVLKINFKLRDGGVMGNNLTFDKRGNCYFFSYSGGAWAPKWSTKIVRGTIGKQSVKFQMTMQAIRYSPSRNIQGMGYNPSNDRLYLVSNGTVMTVPAKKLGKLRASDVKVGMFDGQREFESVAFDKTGRGFLLVNKEPELMLASKGF